MKSTLKIALTGFTNDPVIRVEKVSSDDMRDIIVSQFFERLCGDSALCHVHCTGTGNNSNLWEISPLPPNSHYICHQRIEEIYKSICFPFKDSTSDITMTTGGDHIGFYKEHGKGPGIELDRNDLRSLNIVELVRVVSDTISKVITDNSIATPTPLSNS